MLTLSPSLVTTVARINLDKLFNSGIDAKHFRSAVRRLENRFSIYAATCPAPFIAPDLIVTPEIRRQSELYLPIAEISRIFNRLYRQALTYPPILSSPPFHRAVSWADVFVSLPPRLQFSANPAQLLEVLLSDKELLHEFLFASFLPHRFYGGFGRYPGQVAFIRKWLATRRRSGNNRLRCMDAACGTGEDSYGLVNLLMESEFVAEEIEVEGWTLEPLEVWVAAHLRFPYDQKREATFRRETSSLFELGYQSCIRFRSVDLTGILFTPTVFLPPSGPRGCLQGEGRSGDGADRASQFDIILCNGLLGGPIINEALQLEQVVKNLACFLAPRGILLAANSFHGGWKSRCRNADLKALFLKMGMQSFDAGEGVGGFKL